MYPKEKFVLIERCDLKGSKEYENKFVLFISPNELNKDPEMVNLLTLNKGYQEKIADLLWFFHDADQARIAAEEVFKKQNGQVKVAVNLADKIVVHEQLKIISSYGINSNCKLAEDIDEKNFSIRIFSTVFENAPSNNYVLKDGDISGDKIHYWDAQKLDN